MEGKHLIILQCQHLQFRSQGISSDGIKFVLPEQFGLDSRRVNTEDHKAVLITVAAAGSILEKSLTTESREIRKDRYLT